MSGRRRFGAGARHPAGSNVVAFEIRDPVGIRASRVESAAKDKRGRGAERARRIKAASARERASPRRLVNQAFGSELGFARRSFVIDHAMQRLGFVQFEATVAFQRATLRKAPAAALMGSSPSASNCCETALSPAMGTTQRKRTLPLD